MYDYTNGYVERHFTRRQVEGTKNSFVWTAMKTDSSRFQESSLDVWSTQHGLARTIIQTPWIRELPSIELILRSELMSMNINPTTIA
ncbi:unnamed protein product, partial [Nesidiocoris tenuis]